MQYWSIIAENKMKHELIIREPDLYFDSIHQELNNFLRDTFSSHAFAHPLNLRRITTWRPAIEVKQTDDNYKIKVQLPGVQKDNIIVDLDNDFMTITAETHEEKEEEKQEKKNERLHTSEFRYGKYMRTISFDQPIKVDEATAEYKHGVLHVTIPKQETVTKEPKRLTINTKDM